MVQELLAEVYESLRCGKGSGCSPPCVTRWSGGAVVHDRGALLRRGLRRRTTTHHVVELGSQHYRGQFNVVPGTGFVWTPVVHLLVRSWYSSGRRRAVGSSAEHRRFWWWWWCSCCRAAMIGDGVYCCAASVVLGPRGDGLPPVLWQHCCHGRSGQLLSALLWLLWLKAQVQKRSACVAPCARLLTCLAWQVHTFCMLVSNTAKLRVLRRP